MHIIHILPHSLEPFAADLHSPTDWQRLEHHVVGFIRNLQKVGGAAYTHELWTLSSVHKEAFNVTHREGFTIRVFPRDFPSFLPIETSLNLLREARKTARTQHVDCWHMHSYYLWMYDFLAVLLSWQRQPFVAHYRGGAPTWRSLPYSLYHFGIALPFTLRLAKKIFVQNTREQRRLQKRYKIKPDTILLLPNCTEVGQASISRSSEVPHIVYAGRVIAYKGLTEILTLCRTLRASGKKFVVEIIGDGALLPTLQKEFRDDWVIFRASATQAETKAHLQRADIFVFGTTKTEGSPYFLIEAQGVGLPAIAWQREGIEDVIEDGTTGYLVETWTEFQDHLGELVNNPQLRRQMGANAQKKIAESFSCKKLMQQVLAVYTT